MKPADIKNKARAKAQAMEPITRTFNFEDKAGVPGSCQVTLPADNFSYIVSKRVAENLLNTYGADLPFDLMRPLSVCEDGNWVEVKPEHLVNRKLPEGWDKIEILLPMPFRDDLGDMFQSPNAQ